MLTLGDVMLFVVVASLASNHVVVRITDWALRPYIFWPLQLANLSAIVFLVGWGVPGLDGTIAVFNYVLALLFVMRSVQNNRQWGEARRQQRKASAQQSDEEWARVLQALRSGEDKPPQ